jgi:hypothetical protein
MLILKELGLKITGDKYFDEISKDFNPTGMWEIKTLPYNGLQKILFTTGVPEINGGKPIPEDGVLKVTFRGYIKSDLSIISKLIICIRDPREIVASQRKQLNHISDKHCWNLLLGHYCAMTEAPITCPTLVVDYNDVMWDKKKEVQRVADFVGVPVTQAALDAVRPELYRSKKHKVKRDRYCKAAEMYHRAFRGYIK